MTNSSTPIPPLSDGTTAALANLVGYTIEREYGHAVDDAIQGARVLALAGLQFDLHGQFVGINGNANGLMGYAEATLRILVRDGLEARRCQCPTINGNRCPHTPVGSCSGHYEADVPPIAGALLCGTCHIAEYQARTNAELAKLAIEGYQAEEEQLLTRDAEARHLYIAFHEAARRDQDAALATSPNDVFALTPDPSPATTAAYDAYHARLKQIAESRA